MSSRTQIFAAVFALALPATALSQCVWGSFDVSRTWYSTGTLTTGIHKQLRTIIGSNGATLAKATPTLTPSAKPVSGSFITLNASSSSGLRSSQGLMIIGLAPISVPFLDGTLLASLGVLISVAVLAGGLALPVAVPRAPVRCNASLYLQYLQLDAGASEGRSFTPGLRLTIGR